MTRYGGNDYVYTKSGFLKYKIAASDTTTYAYDNYGNLISVKLPNSDIIQYAIDGTNRRIGKKLNGNWVQKFIYLSDLAPAAELDSADNVVARFIYSKHQNVPDYIFKGGTTYKIITDQLGSVRLVIDYSTGSVVQQIYYDEFGQVIFDSNPGFQPFGYAGGLYDQQTKLVRFGARDYDAITGRWTAKDPIGFAGGNKNIYVYTNSNVINQTDPKGEFAWGTFFANTIAGTVTGAAIGAGMNLVQQTVEGYLNENGDFSINWNSFFEDMGKGALVGALGGAATGFMASLGYSEVIAHHAAHHTFTVFGKSIGKWPHLQITRYIPGVKNSDKIIRIMLPW